MQIFSFRGQRPRNTSVWDRPLDHIGGFALYYYYYYYYYHYPLIFRGGWKLQVWYMTTQSPLRKRRSISKNQNMRYELQRMCCVLHKFRLVRCTNAKCTKIWELFLTKFPLQKWDGKICLIIIYSMAGCRILLKFVFLMHCGSAETKKSSKSTSG